MERKDHRNPKACICIQAYMHACSSFACASFMHVYTNTSMDANTRVPKTIKGKFFCIKDCLGMNLTSFRSHSKPLVFYYKKLYMIPFQKRQKIWRENTRFTRNSESKREFFTKHLQVNIFLIKTFSGLDLWVSRFN